MKNKFKKSFVVIGFIVLTAIMNVTKANAATANLAFSGNSNPTVGTEFTLDIVVTGNNGNIVTIGGEVNSSDSNCVTFKSLTKVDAGSSVNNLKFNFVDFAGKSGNFTLVKATFVAGASICETKVNIKNGTISFDDSSSIPSVNISQNITVGAAKNTDATLSSLVPSTGTLSPAFAANTTTYSLDVGDGITSVNFTATPNHTAAQVTSGTTCNLSGTTTACRIVVKAESGATKTYTVNVKKPVKNNDATLKSLTPSVGTLSPEFSASTLVYELEVNEGTESITFTGTTNNTKAKIVSGATCDITNSDSCKIVVEAEDGSRKTYTVNINKKQEAPVVSSDKTLSSLEITGHSLTPSFHKENTSYSLEVGNDVSELDINALPSSDKATVSITGNKDLKEGMNTVAITVTAEDGTKQIYSINVYKKPKAEENNTTEQPKTAAPKSNDNYLSSLIISNGEIKPSFNKNTSSYDITIPSDVDRLDINYVTSDKKAKVKVTGNENLKVGLNTVTLEVTAEDGSVRYYTINVNKSEIESNNKLASLTVDGYSIKPGFHKDIFSYDLTVPYNVNEIDVNALAQNSNAKIEITGDKDLKEGNNVVLVKVTDENGFVQYYTLNVNKEAKQEAKFLGLTWKNWLMILGFLLLVGLLIVIILLLKRRKDTKEEAKVAEKQAPVIEFKPEFNFGSKNGTDDDVVEEGGVLNQYTNVLPNNALPNHPSKQIVEEVEEIEEAKYTDTSEIPYDSYDATVTKDEIVDAIHEALNTKDPEKLKLLLDQDALNKRKKALKAKEKERENGGNK